MRKSQGIILVPAKGTVVTQAPIPTHGNHPCGLQENADLTEESFLACPPRPQLHSCPGQMGPTLVDELVEGVLAIGPWLPPHNGARLVVHTGAGLGDVLPIGLHVSLEWGQKPSHRSASLSPSCTCPKPAWDAPGTPALPWLCEIRAGVILLCPLIWEGTAHKLFGFDRSEGPMTSRRCIRTSREDLPKSRNGSQNLQLIS